LLYSKLTSCAFLGFLGLIFVSGNLWFTAARSTIPIAIDGVIHNTEKRLEKKSGVDDVFLLTFDNGRVIQVDRPLFELAEQGSRFRKDAWSVDLSIDSQWVELEWSRDFRFMCIVMPIACLAMLGSCILTYWRSLVADTNAT
jgi:hypothetical protein